MRCDAVCDAMGCDAMRCGAVRWDGLRRPKRYANRIIKGKEIPRCFLLLLLVSQGVALCVLCERQQVAHKLHVTILVGSVLLSLSLSL